MRIAHIVNSLGRGGAENLVIGLAREMVKHGHSVCIISLTDNVEYDDLIANHQIDVRCCGSQGTIYSLLTVIRTAQRLRSQLAGFQPDVVNTHIYLSDILARIVIGWRVPVVTTFHRNEDWWRAPLALRKWIKRWLESITARRLSRQFIAVSATSLEEAVQFLGVARQSCRLIKNGVDTTRFKPLPHPTVLSHRIIQIARFYPEKCHDVSLKAFRRVLETIPDAELWLVGDGPCRAEIEQMAAQLGLGDSVQFLGLRKDIDKLLQQCAVFWLSSRLEGLPISLLEAMAIGVAPVVTAVGDIPNVITHGRNGFLAASGDDAALAKHSCDLLLNADLHRLVSAAAVRTVEKEYSIVETTAGYLDVYNAAHTRQELYGIR